MPEVGRKIRLVVADDFPIMRRGVERALSRAPDLELAGEASDVDELMALLGRDAPDVVVLDLGMPGAVGVEHVRRVRRDHPAVKVLVYTMYPEDRVGIRCLKAGANGFLHKSQPIERLVDAIREVATGRRFISPELAELLIAHVPDPRDELPHDLLTERELEVLRALASGLPTREIAERLGVTVKTVHSHRANVLEKLQLRSTVDLVHYSLDHALLGWEPDRFDSD